MVPTASAPLEEIRPPRIAQPISVEGSGPFKESLEGEITEDYNLYL